MAFLQHANKGIHFAVAMVAAALLGGCPGKLEEVPRDVAATDSTPVDKGADAPTDQANNENVDAGDELGVDVKVDASEIGDTTIIPDADVVDGSDVASENVADVMGDVPNEMSPDVTGDSPCPPVMATVCAGACVNVQTNAMHCGACGRACTIPNGTAGCVMGACTVMACNAGFDNCDREVANGCETDLTNTALHCGTCGTACAEPTPLCSGRTCSSGCTLPGETRCGTSCVNVQTNVMHCGTCGMVCATRDNATVACTGSTCRYTCSPSFHECRSMCVSDIAVESCGTRCEPCPVPSNAVATCTAGGCGFTCLTGFADCDGVAANGCEINLMAESAHCGRCGAACAATGTCSGGLCTLVVDASAAGRLGREGDSTYLASRTAPEAQFGNPRLAAATLTRAGLYSIVRGWFAIPVPMGALVSITLRIYGPYMVTGDRSPGLGVQAVAFSTATVLPAAPLLTDYELSHWGEEGLFVEPISASAFMMGEGRATFAPVGVTYFQRAAGMRLYVGLRTTYDLDNRSPSADYSGFELTERTPPGVQLTFRYRP